jgi:hypothetical protein
MSQMEEIADEVEVFGGTEVEEESQAACHALRDQPRNHLTVSFPRHPIFSRLPSSISLQFPPLRSACASIMTYNQRDRIFTIPIPGRY